GARAIHLDATDGMLKFRWQVARRKHSKKRPLWIRIRQHHARADLGAIGERNAPSASIAHINLSDRRRSSNLNSEAAPGLRQRLGDGAHPSHHVPEKSLQFMLAAAQQMKQQANCSSWLVRTTVLAVDIVSQKHCLDGFGF